LFLVSDVLASRASLVVVQRHHAEFDVMLRIGLADIDHVEVSRGATESRMIGIVLAGIRRSYPRNLAIRVGVKYLVVKIQIELTELPQMKADVLACIG